MLVLHKSYCLETNIEISINDRRGADYTALHKFVAILKLHPIDETKLENAQKYFCWNLELISFYIFAVRIPVYK